jgi:hypothetical protein
MKLVLFNSVSGLVLLDIFLKTLMRMQVGRKGLQRVYIGGNGSHRHCWISQRKVNVRL